MPVRAAQEEDVEPLADLWHDAWRDAHLEIVPAALARLRTRDSFRDRLKAALTDVRVAGPTGAALGFSILKDDELYQLFVARDARGSGVAAALLADAEARLAVRGVATAWLACAIGNHRAARFYEKWGWRRTGTTVSRLETPDGIFPLEVWRYEKALAVPFDLRPVLKGRLVELRPLRPDDYDALYAVAADPLIWEQHPASNRHQAAVFQAFFRDALESGGALLALDASTGEVIGSSRYHGYDRERSEIEIGWTFLSRSRWGGAVNGEMKRLMLDHAFRFVRRVIFVVGPRNYRSQRALQKIGAVRAGSRQDPDGHEKYVFAIGRDAWALRRDG